MNYPTPHINAKPEDFGQTVLMPGDPLRSKYIAENFLENAKLVNNVRGVQGYTGFYKGVKVSVMASGMGIPSIGIYSYELYNAFGVQNIMRIGSAGSINPDIHVRDIVIAQGACTDSNFLHQYHIDGTFAPIASYEMMRKAVESCEQVGATYHVGNVLSTDNFYNDDEGLPEVCNQLARSGKRVIVAGLDMDFKGVPFGPMPQLMAIADEVTKVHAICVKCGNLAYVSHRIVNDDERVLLGELQEYEPLCRQCYDKAVKG